MQPPTGAMGSNKPLLNSPGNGDDLDTLCNDGPTGGIVDATSDWILTDP